MAIKNTLMGGTDWSTGAGIRLDAVDLNDTFNAGVVLANGLSTTASSGHTGDTNWTDITSLTVTVSNCTASSTYKIVANASGKIGQSTVGGGWVQMLINGTVVCTFGALAYSSISVPVSLSGYLEVTGETSYITKLQYKTDNGSGTVTWSSGTTSGINVLAIKKP
jgi:hypothetical protein